MSSKCICSYLVSNRKAHLIKDVILKFCSKDLTIKSRTLFTVINEISSSISKEILFLINLRKQIG